LPTRLSLAAWQALAELLGKRDNDALRRLTKLQIELRQKTACADRKPLSTLLC
jgi:hypothetical protein